MVFLLQTEWPDLISKVGFPTTILIVIGLVLRYAFWPYFKKKQDDASAELKQARADSVAAVAGVVEDAHKERDYMRQLREKESQQFLDALRSRDEKMERGFSEVVAALRELKSEKVSRER